MGTADTEIKIDQDIEELLGDIAKNARPKRLIVFNDSHHTMDEVVLQVIRARHAGGQPCTAKEAVQIMHKAHSSGQAVVMSGKVEDLEKARAVLEAIDLRTDIIE
jgi:ATP-dependent Clp protease adapter protein ClpS